MSNKINKINVGGVEYTLPSGSTAHVEGNALYINNSGSGSNSGGSGSSGSGLALVGNYPIIYSEADAGYKILHPSKVLPTKSIFVEVKTNDSSFVLLSGTLMYFNPGNLSSWEQIYGLSIDVPNSNGTLSILIVHDPTVENSHIDIKLNIGNGSSVTTIPLDGYIISVYTLN